MLVRLVGSRSLLIKAKIELVSFALLYGIEFASETNLETNK